MRVVSAFCAIAGFLALTSGALASSCDGKQTFVLPGDIKAESFNQLSDAEVTGYIAGFGSGILVASLLGSPIECYTQASSCITGRPVEQLVAILRKYMADHPDKWRLPASVVAYNALIGPCFGLKQ